MCHGSFMTTTAPERAASKLPLIALFLGIATLLLVILPLYRVAAGPVGVAGLAVGIVAVVKSAKAKSGLAMSIVGLSLTVVAAVLLPILLYNLSYLGVTRH